MSGCDRGIETDLPPNSHQHQTHPNIPPPQGDCEHAFIVSDLRLPGPEDDRDARLYPMLTFQKHYRKRRCAICDARPAQYVAIRDPLGDEARNVYCEFCHFQLHYDKDGHLLHEGFEVFPYLHDE